MVKEKEGMYANSLVDLKGLGNERATYTASTKIWTKEKKIDNTFDK